MRIFALTFLLVSQSWSASVDALTFEADNGKLTVTAIDSAATGTLVVPSIYLGLPVTKIASFAFVNSNITGIYLPDSITSIDPYAFTDCKISNLTIPHGVTSIEPYTFYDSDLTSVFIPDSVTSIGDNAFAYSDLTYVLIPDTITTIGKGAFYQCTKLVNAVLPNALEVIDMDVFHACHSLTSIKIPNSVKAIGSSAFYQVPIEYFNIPTSLEDLGWNGLSSFNSFNYTDSNGDTLKHTVTYVEDSTFRYVEATNGMLLMGLKAAYDEDEEHNYPNDLVIPSEVNGKPVMVINSNAFDSNKITSIIIPNSIIAIGSGAFSGCQYLTSVTLPNSLKVIPESAFDSCSRLTSITLPDSIKSIGVSAFNYCSSLTSIVIPNSVTTIGENAFSHCSALLTAQIPERFVTQLNSIGIPIDLQDDIFYGAVRNYLTSNPEFIASIAESIQSNRKGEGNSNTKQSVGNLRADDIFGGFNDLGHYVISSYRNPQPGIEMRSFLVYNRNSEEIFSSSQLPSIPEFAKPKGFDSYEAFFFNDMLIVGDGTNSRLICYSYDETAETYLRDLSIGSVFREDMTRLQWLENNHNYYSIIDDASDIVTHYKFNNKHAGLPGPKGDRGDKGDVGAQGPAGDTGAIGERGTQGPRGADSTAIQELRASGEAIKLNPNGNFSINYSIETSDDLERWKTISNTSSVVQPSGDNKQFLRLTIK